MTSGDGFGLVLWCLLAASFLTGFVYLSDPYVLREVGDLVMWILGVCYGRCSG